MISSAVTISLVEEARGGPFVFWDGLADGCERAARLGFDAVELFAPDAKAVNPDELRGLLELHGLKLAAVGTGAGALVHNLRLTDPDARRRERARDFVRSIIDFGGPLGAPAIIGSMQGRHREDVDHATAMGWLTGSLFELADHAGEHGVPLIYEPLNRYETNLINTLGAAAEMLDTLETNNVKLLADLFHMNIEEADPAAALREAGERVGHVHFVDSNRRPAGLGHLDYPPIVAALRAIDYQGFASAEALPYPDSHAAAGQTMRAFRQNFR